MKKSTFILILKIVAAVAGAIVATLTAQSCSITADFSKQNLVLLLQLLLIQILPPSCK